MSENNKQVRTMIVREILEWEWIGKLLDDELASWSPEAAEALYDYYWSIAIKDGKPFLLELDVLRSEWTEYNEQDARNRFRVKHDITEIGLNMDPRIEEVIAFKGALRKNWKYLIKPKR
jgi:hypothetical protein